MSPLPSIMLGAGRVLDILPSPTAVFEVDDTRAIYLDWCAVGDDLAWAMQQEARGR